VTGAIDRVVLRVDASLLFNRNRTKFECGFEPVVAGWRQNDGHLHFHNITDLYRV